MGFISGNIVSSTQPGVDLIDAIIAEMVNEGWVLEEDYAKTADQHYITYKSPAANNAHGADWYVTLERDTTAGSEDDAYILAVGEDYIDSTTAGGTPQMSDFCVQGVDDSVPAADGTWGGSPTAVDQTVVQLGMIYASLSTNDQPYWAHITGDYLIVSTGTGACFVGFYEPFIAGVTNHVPLCAIYTIGLTSTNTNIAYGGVSRVPWTVDATPFNIWLATGDTLWAETTYNTPELGDYNPLYDVSDLVFAQRFMMRSGYLNDADESFRGFLPATVLKVPRTGSVPVGDTLTISGSQYVHVGSDIWLANGL